VGFQLDLGEVPAASPVRGVLSQLCKGLSLVGSIRVRRELTDGFSGTRVFVVDHQLTPDDPQPRQLIFKVGPIEQLRDELRRYRSIRDHVRSGGVFARMLDPDLVEDSLPADGLGAIAYEHAASSLARRDSVSFRDRARGFVAGGVDAAQFDELVAATGAAIASLQGAPTIGFAFPILCYYVDRWAPDYRVTVERMVPMRDGVLLTLRRLDPAQFGGELDHDVAALRSRAEDSSGPAPVLALHQLQLRWSSASEVRLEVPDAQLTIDVGIAGLPDDTVAQLRAARNLALWAPAGPTRFDFYRARFQTAFPYADPASRTLVFGGRRLHNPLAFLSRFLDEQTRAPVRTWFGPAHGDLHPGNVLVVGTTPVIIDYGLSDANAPLGADLARLFGGIVRDVLAPAMSEAELVIAIAAALAGDTSLADDASVAASRGFHVLDALARAARALPAAEHWALHLYGFGLIAAKWPGNANAYRGAFVLSALALGAVLPPVAEVRRRILIIEDDQESAELMQMLIMMKRGDLDVRTVPTVAAGMEALRHETFDGLIVDVSLPDGDGLDLLAWLRKRSPTMRVMVATGATERSIANASHRLDATIAFKPVSDEDLLHFVDSIPPR
jgi:CheY-like chemotaxis protein